MNLQFSKSLYIVPHTTIKQVSGLIMNRKVIYILTFKYNLRQDICTLDLSLTIVNFQGWSLHFQGVYTDLN